MTKQTKETKDFTGLGLGGFEKELLNSRRSITEISVDIIPSQVFSEAAKYTLLSADRIFRDSVNAPIVERELLEKYFFDALVHRVMIARSARPNYKLRSRAQNYPLPAIVYNAIRQVGLATDKSFGIRFLPSLSLETLNSISAEEISSHTPEDNRYSEYKPMSDGDFDRVLNMFQAMEDEGYVITGALSREIYGDINFMAMTNVENETNGPRGYRDVNPVYAFYRSFFYNQQLSQLCSTIYTYQYNDINEMTNILRNIVLGKGDVSGLSQVMSEFR